MNQRGTTVLALLLGIIVLIGIAGMAYYLGSQRSVTPQPQSQVQTPTQQPVAFQTPQSTPSAYHTQVAAPKDKIDLTNQLKKETIFMDAPENAEIKLQKKTSEFQLYIETRVEANGSLYSILPQDGGRGGPCPMEDFGTKCGYTDDIIDVKPPLKISAVRVWKDEKGIFLINPWDIYVKDTGINSILISKLQPNKIFSQEEVNMWKQLLTTIRSQ